MPLDEQLKHTISTLCADVAPDILHDFLSRMDQEYFRRFEPATVAQHIRLAAELTPEHPCEVTIAERDTQQFDLTIVAYDYFSEFANICGLLSAFGLNIEEGQIYTFADSAAPMPNTSRTRAASALVKTMAIRPKIASAAPARSASVGSAAMASATRLNCVAVSMPRRSSTLRPSIRIASIALPDSRRCFA